LNISGLSITSIRASPPQNGHRFNFNSAIVSLLSTYRLKPNKIRQKNIRLAKAHLFHVRTSKNRFSLL